MDLTPKAIPVATRQSKDVEKYELIFAAWHSLPIGECIEVMKEDVSPATLEQKARKLIVPDAGEHLRLTKLTDENQKLCGIRLSKVAYVAPKEKSQGKVEAPKGDS